MISLISKLIKNNSIQNAYSKISKNGIIFELPQHHWFALDSKHKSK